MVSEVQGWYDSLGQERKRVAATVRLLAKQGPMLGRPHADRIEGSSIHNMKELRPTTSIRILFVFDPDREAVLLVAGDKAGKWNRWYRDSIPLAEQRYQDWINGEYDEE